MQSNAAPDAPSDVAGTPFRLAVQDSIEAAEAPWRALEQDAVLTPYQRYDWIKALLDSRPPAGDRYAIAVVHDGDGPGALFPFALRRRLGVRTARLIGSEVGNADWLILRRQMAPRLTPAVLTLLFAEIGQRAGGLDAVLLGNQPSSWLGVPNPLLGFVHQPGPDHLYVAPLTAAGETGRLNAKHLRNIRRGRRRLAEAMGPVEVRRAESVEEIATVHKAFLAQRGARFARMGVPNVFAEAWFIDFFRRAAATSLGSDRPALRFHALWAGGKILATSCGTCAGQHYSQYINSTDSGPASRYSLTGILMHDLVIELAAMGITSIDMGLGDFDYKTDWTDPLEVYDGAVALTAAGRVAARAFLGARALKRAVKRNPQLFGAFKRLRGAALRAGGPGSAGLGSSGTAP